MIEPKAIDPKHLSDIERDLPGIGQGYNTGNLSARYLKDVTALLADRQEALARVGERPFPGESRVPKLETQLESMNRVCKALEERNEELRKKIEY